MATRSYEDVVGTPAKTSAAKSYEDVTTPPKPSDDPYELKAFASDIPRFVAATGALPRTLLYDLPNAVPTWLGGPTEEQKKNDPYAQFLNKWLPSQQGILEASGVAPYLSEHTSLPGKLAGAVIEGGGIKGLMNPAKLARMWREAQGFRKVASELGQAGVSQAAAAGAAELDPDNPWLQIAAGTLTHGGIDAARGLYKGAVKPYANPNAAGRESAFKAPMDNQLPGLAEPSLADVGTKERAVQYATDLFGPDAHPPAVMDQFRDLADTVKGHLESNREAQSAPLYNAFRADKPLEPAEALTQAEKATRWPLGLPGVPSAMQNAARNMRSDVGGPRAANNPYGGPYAKTEWTDFNAAGDPVYKTTLTPTPDLLDRTKRQLNVKATQAAAKELDKDTAASRINEAEQIDAYLRRQYPETFPAASDMYKEQSKPLIPFEHPDVAKALARNKSAIGEDLGPVMGPEQLLDHIGASGSPSRTVQAFIDAVGDKKAVVQPLETAIVGKLRQSGAVDPQTGEIDVKKFKQETSRYMPTISMYIPELGKKFATAEAAQASLNKIRVQEELASNIKDAGGMRSGGIVTPESIKTWIGKNRKDLQATQDPAAIMRLQQIANALPDDPFKLADSAVEPAMSAMGWATGGGLEGGFIGNVAGKTVRAALGGQLKKARDAYSEAIEKAVFDPKYAEQMQQAIGTARGVAQKQRMLEFIARQMGRNLGAGVIATAPVYKAP